MITYSMRCSPSGDEILMKKFTFTLVLSFAMIAGAVPVYAQSATTCGQQAAYVSSMCDSAPSPARCRTNNNFQQKLADCFASGTWTNPYTGKVLSLRKE